MNPDSTAELPSLADEAVIPVEPSTLTPYAGLVALTVLVPGTVLLGALTTLFSASVPVRALLPICAAWLLRSGRGGIVPVGILASILWFLVVRSRVWPEVWAGFSPWVEPRLWAAMCAALWLATLATITALGLLTTLPSAPGTVAQPLRLAGLVLAGLAAGSFAC